MNKMMNVRAAIALALGSSLIPAAQAAGVVLPKGALLTITGTVTTSGAFLTGSYFAMDTNGNNKVAASEKVALAQGTTGFIIGTTTAAGSHHPGAPTAGDSNVIDAAWNFFGNTGTDYVMTVPVTGGTSGLDMSGWTVAWSGIPAIPMGTGAWQTGTGAGHTGATGTFTNGVGNFYWNGLSGDTYTLSYRATVPAGDPSGFGNVKYELHLEGTVENDPPVALSVNMGNIAVNSSGNVLKPGTTPFASDPNTGPNANTATPNYALTCSVVTPAAHGTATVASDCGVGVDNSGHGTYTPGTSTYTPTAGYTGTDSFVYRVSDGLDTADGTVSVTVVAGNLSPQALDDAATTVTNTAVIVNVIANDTDQDGTINATTVVPVSPSTHGGTIVAHADGTVTYTPASGFTGTDTFTYTVQDNQGAASNVATVTVTVGTNVPASNSGTLSAGSYGGSDGRVTNTSTLPADSGVTTSCIGGCFDFSVSGVTSSVKVVLPLTVAVPSGGSLLTYRKLHGSTWVSFSATGGNALSTAAGTGTDGTPAACPPPGSVDNAGVTGYRNGLTAGDRCIQLTIVDGGPNDADGAVNGTVVDPGGLGLSAAASPAPIGTSGGCSIATSPVDPLARGDWWILAGFVAWLGAVVRRRRV